MNEQQSKEKRKLKALHQLDNTLLDDYHVHLTSPSSNDENYHQENYALYQNRNPV